MELCLETREWSLTSWFACVSIKHLLHPFHIRITSAWMTRTFSIDDTFSFLESRVLLPYGRMKWWFALYQKVPLHLDVRPCLDKPVHILCHLPGVEYFYQLTNMQPSKTLDVCQAFQSIPISEIYFIKVVTIILEHYVCYLTTNCLLIWIWNCWFISKLLTKHDLVIPPCTPEEKIII